MKRTRIVHWLRVVLPLIALAILSTMFLLSGKGGEESSIPFTETEVERLAGEALVVAPEYSGVTSDGSELTLRAKEVSPGDAGGGADRLQLNVRNNDGLSAELTAPDAAVENNLIILRGGVNMTTSSGWKLDAERIDTTTDRSSLTANEGVDAVAPFGKITAGKLDISPATSDSAENDANNEPGAVMNFTDGVRLIYTP